MRIPLSERLSTVVLITVGVVVGSYTSAVGKDFDGVWAVNIVADDANCPTHVIPVQVSDGAVSFSGFGATATGRISAGGAVKLSISFNEQVVRVNGRVRGREGSGNWRSAPAGCEGHWSAAITE